MDNVTERCFRCKNLIDKDRYVIALPNQREREYILLCTECKGGIEGQGFLQEYDTLFDGE